MPIDGRRWKTARFDPLHERFATDSVAPFRPDEVAELQRWRPFVIDELVSSPRLSLLRLELRRWRRRRLNSRRSVRFSVASPRQKPKSKNLIFDSLILDSDFRNSVEILEPL
jgi:hypothetical protein